MLFVTSTFVCLVGASASRQKAKFPGMAIEIGLTAQQIYSLSQLELDETGAVWNSDGDHGADAEREPMRLAHIMLDKNEQHYTVRYRVLTGRRLITMFSSCASYRRTSPPLTLP